MKYQHLSILLMVLLNVSNYCFAKMTTEQKLSKFRTQMKSVSCDAFIIPSEDEHQSEYVAAYDMRRAWITGFTGSAGEALITDKNALLWTDSRYYIQANEQLDTKYWKLMKASDPGTQSILGYLIENLSAKSTVCQDSRYFSIARWQSRDKFLKENGLNLIDTNDIIDDIWPQDERSPKPNTEVITHGIPYSDETFDDKLKRVAKLLEKEGAQTFVVTALDEVAWLFNLRASDIPYNPMFFAYAIIDTDSTSLYINSTRPKFQEIASYLKGINVRPYEAIIGDISLVSSGNNTIWISPASSYYIYNAVTNKDNLIIDKASPIRSMKAVKSENEMKNFRSCQLRDSAFRIRHMYWLETEMAKGTLITEDTAAKKLEEIESEDLVFKSLSFESISAVGPNAAVVHYATSEGDNSTLTKENIYLLDAGAQFMDCTTDITRTHHFGTPSSKEKFAYTKVLQGSIDLSNIYFPTGVYGSSLDVEARASLWRAGLDYGHGTGHGIGYFLSVHEAPPGIAYNSRGTFAEPLAVGMVTSDEPGYYEEGEFGIRLETDLEVVEAKTEYNFGNRKTLKFNALTLVPFEKKLISQCLLTKSQVDWLNEYNLAIREKVHPILSKFPEIQKYLMDKTTDFKYTHLNADCSDYNSSNRFVQSNSLILICFAAIWKIIF